MHKVKTLLNHLRFAATSKTLVVSAFAIITGSILALNIAGSSAVDAAKCNQANDIIHCGAQSAGEFVNKYNANESKDLHSIYNHYGLSPEEISRFAATAKMGTAYKDGRIEVDGQVVATNAHSLGRTTLGGQNNTPVSINGTTYHYGPSSRNFSSDSIPVIVMMNPDTHEMEFAALTVCGNPIWGNSPKYKCDMLQKEQVNRTTYKFSTRSVAENGAAVSRVVYEFGDGTTETRTNPAEVVTHTYAKPGNYRAKVTVYFNVNGKEVSDTRQSCETPVEVKVEPAFACTAVTGKLITRNEYEFTAHTEVSGGAKLVSGVFDYGDNAKSEAIIPQANTPTKIIGTHKYAKDGSYKIVATIKFQSEAGVTSKTCEVPLTISPEACPINPSVPVNDPKCQPCEYNPQLPVGHPDCKATVTPPATLPETGPADLLGGVFGLGSVTAAGTYYFRSRRHLIDRLLNK